MSEQEIIKPVISFHALEDGTVVFEIVGENGVSAKVIYPDDPGYIMGVSECFQKAAIIQYRVQVNGDSIEDAAAEHGGIKGADVINFNDIDWGDGR